MPVAILLCEGTLPGNRAPGRAPDVRLIRQVLRGVSVQITPRGSKYGMHHRIAEWRQSNPNVFALWDGDYREHRSTVPALLDEPEECIGNDGKILGWRWRRKEIENYLLDPLVLARALQLTQEQRDAYVEVLHLCVQRLAWYQAARTALSLCRRKRVPLPNLWGRRSASLHHAFPGYPRRKDCRARLREVVEAHNCIEITADLVLTRFQQILPEFLPGGSRRTSFLYDFAGKDLLCALAREAKRQPPREEIAAALARLTPLQLDAPSILIERLLARLEASAEEISPWLPEWAALRTRIETAP